MRTISINKRVLDGFINMLLVLNLVAAFLMTDQDISAQYGSALYLFSDISILFFVVEIAVRMWMCSRGGSMWYFFRSNGKWHHWNCFDFTVTLLAAVSLSSGLGVFVGARTLRMLRLLNTMRLFSRYQRLPVFLHASIFILIHPNNGQGIIGNCMGKQYQCLRIGIAKFSVLAYLRPIPIAKFPHLLHF